MEEVLHRSGEADSGLPPDTLTGQESPGGQGKFEPLRATAWNRSTVYGGSREAALLSRDATPSTAASSVMEAQRSICVSPGESASLMAT